MSSITEKYSYEELLWGVVSCAYVKAEVISYKKLYETKNSPLDKLQEKFGHNSSGNDFRDRLDGQK